VREIAMAAVEGFHLQNRAGLVAAILTTIIACMKGSKKMDAADEALALGHQCLEQ
jgi:hypothetical protein